MVTADKEDKGADEEDKSEPADMGKPHCVWAPKEDGHNSNNLVVLVTEATVYMVVGVAADAVADVKMDAVADTATTKSFN